MSNQHETKGVTTRTRIKIVLGALLGILVLIIMFQNTETVVTHLLFWQVHMPRFVLLGGMLVLGFVLGLVTMTLRRRRRAKEH